MMEVDDFNLDNHWKETSKSLVSFFWFIKFLEIGWIFESEF